MTLGQLAPEPAVTCGGDTDLVQLTVTSGNSYVVPGNGTITSWSHNAGGNANQSFTMKVFRKTADPFFYMVVGHDGPRPIAANRLNTFSVSFPVKAGDVLGANTASTTAVCLFASPGDTYLFQNGLPDGEAAGFDPDSNFRVNISAVFEPSNSFTVGKAKLNRNKGTATLTVDLPNPGELSASGKGVKAAAAGAVTSKKVAAAGPAKLVIKAKGKQRRTLEEAGKVTLKPRITYTPTGGVSSTQSIKVKLKKR